MSRTTERCPAYAVGDRRVYVSIKLVSATDACIISGADFVAPLSEVSGLLPARPAPRAAGG